MQNHVYKKLSFILLGDNELQKITGGNDMCYCLCSASARGMSVTSIEVCEKLCKVWGGKMLGCHGARPKNKKFQPVDSFGSGWTASTRASPAATVSDLILSYGK